MTANSQNRMPSGSPGLDQTLALPADLVDRLFAASGARSWSLSRAPFASALQRSASKRFGAAQPCPEELTEYLESLHSEDLALAVACAEGCEEAWEHFVAVYRGYLRGSAGAILGCPATSAAASELADSLFAELYGLRDGKRSERSPFRYFHGRSSLKTWLRTVLAQRHVDAIRATRRFRELPEEENGSPAGPSSAPDILHVPVPEDPNLQRYLALFTRTLEVALGLLSAQDQERLRLYYAEQQTLAEIGRTLGEHESSVSRNLERIRRQLRHDVEQALRKGQPASDGASPIAGLSEEQISLCFEHAAEARSEGPAIDFDKLFSRSSGRQPTAGRLKT